MQKPSPSELKQIFEPLSQVSEKELHFLLDHSDFQLLKQDEYLFKKDEEANFMNLIVSGRIRVYGIQNDKIREFTILNSGDITSLLPYSRLKVAVGYGQALEDSWVLSFHRKDMPALIQENYELTEALVHLMSNRIKEFTASRLQNEKMMALGKLSAGLAHELNNPASAIVRSSKALLSHLKQQPDHFKKVMSIKITPKEVEEVTKVLFERLGQTSASAKLSLMQRQALEEDLADCLDDAEVLDADEIAENLVEFNFTCDELEKFKSITGDHFPAVIRWINENLTTEKMVKDIEEASTRISNLVGSVKNFTHMDRSTDKVQVDIHEGINNTLTMLQHKIRAQKIRVEQKFDSNLEMPEGSIGELNQVWTNLLDNAIDALEYSKNPLIEIETSNHPPFIKTFIRDNGPGIPEDTISKIFDPFYTTKDIGKGTGLGLELAKSIIENHQGTIKVLSEPGKTEFEVCLPAAARN